MPAATRKDLYLSVDGGVTSAFTAAMKAGRSTLADFGKSADLSQQAVRDAFAKLGGGDIANAAKEMEAEFNRAFASIRANARQVADAPTNIAAFDILSAQSTREAVSNAELRVAALREVARAAQAAATGDASGGQRAYAVAAEAELAAEERVLAANRAKLGVLEAVEAQMRANGLQTREEAAAETDAAMRRQAIAVEEAAEQAKLVDRNEALLRSIDPLYAAEARFKEAIAEANALREAGVLTEERYTQAVEAAEMARDKVTGAAGRAAQAQRIADTEAEAAAEAKLAARAEQLLQSMNPFYAAHQRYQATLRLTTELEEAGVLTEERAVQIRKGAVAQINATNEALVREANGTAEVTAGHNRMGASGMIAEHVIRSMSDSIEAGQSPMRAFGMEVGRITEAMTMWAANANATEGKIGSLAKFMGSGWGLALSVGVAVLTPFVSKLLQGNSAMDDAVDKLKKDADETRITDAAHRAFALTIEGEIEAQRKLNDELDRQIRTQRQTQQLTLFSARKSVSDQQASRSGLVTKANTQQQEVNAAEAALKGALEPREVQAGIARLHAAKAALAETQQQLRDIDASIVNGQRAVREAEQPLIASDVAASMDKKAAATLRYEKALGLLNARQALGAGKSGTVQALQDDGTFKPVRVTGIDDATYKSELARITQIRDSAIALAEQEKRDEKQGPLTTFQMPVSGYRITGQFGETRPGHTHAGVDLAVPVGTPVRAPAAGTVDVAGQRSGYGNAIYINFGGGTSARFGHLERFNVKPGDRVEAGQIIGYSGGAKGADGSGDSTGPHLHYEVRRGGRAINPLLGKYRTDAGAAGDDADKRLLAAQRAGVRAEDTADNQDREYESQLVQANSRITRARLGLADTTEGRLKVDLDELAFAKTARDKEIADALKAGKYGDPKSDLAKGRAKELTQANDTAFDAEGDLARKKASDAVLDRQLGIMRDELTGQISILQLQSDLAHTNTERLALARQILDKQEQEARATLTEQIAKEDDPDKKTALKLQLANVTPDFALRRQQADRQYADPVARYKLSLQDSVGDMNASLKGVEADGLKGLEDGLLGVIGGTKSAAAAFKQMAASIISDIARIAVEKLILSVVGLKDGGPVLKLAGGGPIFGEGGPRDDKVPALLSHGEYVINADAYSRHPALVQAINTGRLPKFADGGAVGPVFYPELPSAASVARAAPPPQVIYVQVDKADLFDVHVQRAAAPLAQAAMIGGARQAQQDMADQGYARIPT